MTVFYRYRMTISSHWYDDRNEFNRELEMHFKIARSGSPRDIRRKLAQRGVPFLQREILRRFGRWTPRRLIRVRFEKEERASKSERQISVETRTMRYRGKVWRATPHPSRVISYERKKRFAKNKRR